MQLVLLRPHASYLLSIQLTTLQIHALQNPKDNMYTGCRASLCAVAIFKLKLVKLPPGLMQHVIDCIAGIMVTAEPL